MENISNEVEEMRNRLKYWRHYLQIDSKKEFAEFLGISRNSLSRFEKQTEQPGRDTLIKCWLRLKTKIPDIHLEDIIEIDP